MVSNDVGRLFSCLSLTVSLAACSAPVRDVGGGQPMLRTRPVACSAETPVAWRGDLVKLEAWALVVADHAVQPVQYSWSAGVGRLQHPRAQTTLWESQEAPLGAHVITVRMRAADDSVADCSVQIIVRVRQDTMGPGRPSYASFLVPKADEGPATGLLYGLYSYLLFGSPPDASSRDRYIKAVEAYLNLIRPLARLASLLQRERPKLNIVYLPVRYAPPTDREPDAAWVLDNYDYDRARGLLNSVDATLLRGPYLLSLAEPLTAVRDVTGKPRIFQDLSWVPPALVRTWTEQFLMQAAQERFWEERTMHQLALRLRTTVGVLALGYPEVRRAWKDEFLAFLKS